MPKLTIEQALMVVDDELPDGAWMQALCDETGLDAGVIGWAIRQATAAEALDSNASPKGRTEGT